VAPGNRRVFEKRGHNVQWKERAQNRRRNLQDCKLSDQWRTPLIWQVFDALYPGPDNVQSDPVYSETQLRFALASLDPQRYPAVVSTYGPFRPGVKVADGLLENHEYTVLDLQKGPKG
jgi:hypothetical protein